MSTRNRTKYSDEFRASALALLDMQGGNVQGTAKRLDMPETTLREWTRDHEEQRDGTAHTTKLRDIKKSELAQMLASLARTSIEVLDDAQKLQDAPPRDVGVVLGISIDKLQLLTGEATERTERIDRGIYVDLRPPRELVDVEEAEIVSESPEQED